MKTATGLTVIAIGAILAFAVTASPGFLNLQVVGWILMAIGAVGILLTPRSQNWLRRRIIIRRTPSPRPTMHSAPQLAAASAPAAAPAQADHDSYPAHAAPPPRDDQASEANDEPVTSPIPQPVADGTPPEGQQEETIEEYVER